ncbi:MAG: nuclear transport factor 2 family protein [Gammaproteobacteria bacterium]|uniref:nuclear transport factor 2 family protein n=1 Tax=Pseudomaricurvus alcaniphilus TaxID=1166482 RepID=UPI00140E69F6|nr:nuclear transport factor 2 family protein [Pseudomaricurvus alcaniphilus]MBR9909317.1 nuclear transport factor 2 family protein [Gammaproteobacteria bacterium]NHN38253.1 nuclear transport factor 2 family protein [Pseudomaricurvus alcaniphilus]
MEKNQQLEHFVHAQVECWNQGDKEGFLKCYSDIAPNGLSVEIVGAPQMEPQVALEAMWRTQPDIRIDIVCAVVVGNEAVTHHRNIKRSSGELSTDTLEIYQLDDGKLSARYFVSHPGS